MKVVIKPDIAEMLKNKLSKQNKDYALKIYSETCTWDGPKPEMALYEPKETDTIYEAEGIKFIVDDELVKFTESIEIIYGPSYFGNTFLVKL